jgi:hypothetical protein
LLVKSGICDNASPHVSWDTVHVGAEGGVAQWGHGHPPIYIFQKYIYVCIKLLFST